MYVRRYESPLGGILLAADDRGLMGLWFEGQKYFARTLPAAPSGGNVVSARGMGAAGADPLWGDDDLRRAG